MIETKNLTARIKSIDPLGIVDIEFNATMFDNFTDPDGKKVNLLNIFNTSSLNITIIPA